MPITDSAKKKLVSVLQNANVINIVHDYMYDVLDTDGNIVEQENKTIVHIPYNTTLNSLNKYFEKFQAEFTNNDNSDGFNYEYYLKELADECKSIKSQFQKISVNEILIMFRSDCTFKQYQVDDWKPV